MKYICLLVLAAIGFSSCEWGAPKKSTDEIWKDTLNYTYEVIHERAADCGSKSDSACTVVKVKYPVFVNQPLLNDTVAHKLTIMSAMDGRPDSSIQLMTKNFLKAYAGFKKDNPKSAMYYQLDSYAKVLRQDSALVTLETGGYSFQGGAHGSSATFFINWDIKSHKNLQLSDIFAEGYQHKLDTIAEGIFRKDEKLSPTASLANDYFFKDNKFALNDNFSVTPLGLRFIYNQYEIKPYAAGQTELFIPYSQIRSLLRPKSVVAQYIK